MSEGIGWDSLPKPFSRSLQTDCDAVRRPAEEWLRYASSIKMGFLIFPPSPQRLWRAKPTSTGWLGMIGMFGERDRPDRGAGRLAPHSHSVFHNRSLTY